MRGTKYWSSLRTFGLAFAIVLSPALMQTEDVIACPGGDDPTMHWQGDTQLELLAVEVGGEDMIAFSPEEDQYEITLPESHEEIIVKAESRDPEAKVMYNLTDGCAPTAYGHLPDGGGEFAIEPEAVHEGHSLLKVWVHAPEGKADAYSIFMTQPRVCQ